MPHAQCQDQYNEMHAQSESDAFEEDFRASSLAEQAILAYRVRHLNPELFDQVQEHAFSSTSEHPQDGTGIITRREFFPDRSVLEYPVEYGTGRITGELRTNDEIFQTPGICDRRCCDSIRHLLDPEAVIPWIDGRKKPRHSPPTDRTVRR